MTNTKIVETFLSGFNSPEKLSESIALLADDYRFKDPTKENNSKAEFLVTAQELGKVLTGVEIIKVAENGESVAVLYNFKSDVKGLENNFGSEWFRIENGLIKESQLVYDATEWRKVFAKKKKNYCHQRI
ncbi:hypothetical protein CXF68_15755 [Tenacibaculum sp. Bg11-29]|uniref:nuclear transport factor 2 family protein n=1 Tax=Tenacibaculum sp. Bg11-29 TaxID=2058306 RepID=UPI000C324235|nr:nuclear transport factor 2 family protein [Tenacibaculum sp. Bg11-29]PKH52059.1 hypothetical protein CXF68_15755 [Tenacibaculum sp. Bg11-29]